MLRKPTRFKFIFLKAVSLTLALVRIVMELNNMMVPFNPWIIPPGNYIKNFTEEIKLTFQLLSWCITFYKCVPDGTAKK